MQTYRCWCNNRLKFKTEGCKHLADTGVLKDEKFESGRGECDLNESLHTRLLHSQI
jgi:hypothetical protein